MSHRIKIPPPGWTAGGLRAGTALQAPSVHEDDDDANHLRQTGRYFHGAHSSNGRPCGQSSFLAAEDSCRNIGKYHENQRLTCAPRPFTTKITKRHEEERSQMAPTTKPGVLFEHHLAKFEPLALILQPSAFLPNPLQNVKEQAPGRRTHSTLPRLQGNASAIIQIISRGAQISFWQGRRARTSQELPALRAAAPTGRRSAASLPVTLSKADLLPFKGGIFRYFEGVLWLRCGRAPSRPET